MFRLFYQDLEFVRKVHFEGFVALAVFLLDQNFLLQELHGPFSDSVGPFLEFLILVLFQLGSQIPVLFPDFSEEHRVKGVHFGLEFDDGPFHSLHDGLGPGDGTGHLWLVLTENLFVLSILEYLPVLLQFVAVLFQYITILLL